MVTLVTRHSVSVTATANSLIILYRYSRFAPMSDISMMYSIASAILLTAQ